MIRRLLLALALLLCTAQPAWAHATEIRSTPANGAVLAHAPRNVVVEFDDAVRVGPRNAAIRNDGLDVLAGKARVTARARKLVVPLRANLRNGDYSVRWSIVSDDGHEEEGVIAFAVGKGRVAPTAALTSRGIVTWQRALMRTLFYLGILGAGGTTIFALAVLRPLGVEHELRKPEAHLLFFAFLLAFVGSDALVHTVSAGGTRFERTVQVAATAAALGGAAAALAPLYPRLRYGAWAAAGVLLVCPTLSGHALDPDQPRVLAPAADLLHLSAAAVWLGGLASLAFVVVRAGDGVRVAAARRYSTLALGAVVIVAITGLTRALTELSAVHQVWSTSYGRALIVKSALFVPLLGLGWLNRAALLAVFARLRRSVLVELVLVMAIVVAVGVLADERPGRVQAAVAAVGSRAAPTAPAKPPAPPRGAFVSAARAGGLAVAIAVADGQETVTVVGEDGTGVNGLRVVVDGFRARPCGAGCYRAEATGTPTTVNVGPHVMRFAIPLRLHSARAMLARVTREFRAARSVQIDERLSSRPGDVQRSQLVLAPPNTFTYRIVGGPEAIVIGGRRWDRDSPRGPWIESPQTPIPQPRPYWTNAARNAYYVAPGDLTFYEPTIPAWFRLHVDPKTARPIELHMTAAAHFMVDRYSEFDRSVDISPPPR